MAYHVMAIPGQESLATGTHVSIVTSCPVHVNNLPSSADIRCSIGPLPVAHHVVVKLILAVADYAAVELALAVVRTHTLIVDRS